MGWRLNLPWLLKPPLELRHQLKTLINQAENPTESLVRLATHALDINQLHLLYQAIAKVVTAHPESLTSLLSLRLGVLSNGTTSFLAPCLNATGLRYGLYISVVEGDFNQSFQNALDLHSSIHVSQLDVVLVALDHRGIPGLTEDYEENETNAIQQSIEFIKSICKGLSQKPIRLMFQTVPTPAETIFGHADARISGSRRRRIDAFNQHLIQFTSKEGHLLLDIASLAASIGLDRWFDEIKWYMGKLPFAIDILPLYSDHCVRVLATALGKNIRKCLVLDLDNTLWGGVIGDDGLAGIIIGQGTAQGEAHLAIQKMALSLRKRGILLAICSKNDEEVARLPFRKHPDMLLREEHFAVFLANWRDKATNLAAIASALNIGMDALVFLDDHPAERQQVRDALPLVAVPEVPEDPAFFPRILLSGGYFETLNFSKEDIKRADQYQTNADRALDLAKYPDLNEYLRSLEMILSFSHFDEINRARITQLIARSNQFNLTTRRYSEPEVILFETAKNVFTLQIRLSDKFGDSGIISIVICRTMDTVWEIDTWLMSCRVINRRVEEAVLDYIVHHAQNYRASKLVGLYYPTKRNSLVKSHYQKLGFTFVCQEDNVDKWELSISHYQAKHPPITVQWASGELSD